MRQAATSSFNGFNGISLPSLEDSSLYSGYTYPNGWSTKTSPAKSAFGWPALNSMTLPTPPTTSSSLMSGSFNSTTSASACPYTPPTIPYAAIYQHRADTVIPSLSPSPLSSLRRKSKSPTSSSSPPPTASAHVTSSSITSPFAPMSSPPNGHSLYNSSSGSSALNSTPTGTGSTLSPSPQHCHQYENSVGTPLTPNAAESASNV